MYYIFMSIAKRDRSDKKQKGQFLTPHNIAKTIVDGIEIDSNMKILEPSFGKGVFLDIISEKVGWDNLYGCELDSELFNCFLSSHEITENVHHCDFFKYETDVQFDLICGNPPFGGTFDKTIEDKLDKLYGFRNGYKIKKETYAFFIMKSIDLLKDGGKLVFICSDTLISISTMKGLRNYLMTTGSVKISDLPSEFDETKYPMIVLEYIKDGSGLNVRGKELSISDVQKTPNFSWGVDDDLLQYFTGEFVGDYMQASSGMTIGDNEKFLRKINDNHIIEAYDIIMDKRSITLERELSKARLGKISTEKQKKIKEQERNGVLEDYVRFEKLETPISISLPNENYKYYNKASSDILYTKPSYVVYWKNEGEAVYTFKQSGNWYLHGVGGKPFFGKEGLSWQLISSKIKMRYLPSGYILDSGSPIAVLKDGIERHEMFFILGWCLTDIATKILKTVINHTRNIQSKDIERLPYPSWVDDKKEIASYVEKLVMSSMNGEKFTHESKEIRKLNEMYRKMA